MVSIVSSKGNQQEARENFILTAVVPGAAQKFCEDNKITAEVFPVARMHDKDMARFMFEVAKGYPASANIMAINIFAAAVPQFPRDKIAPLFAYVAQEVRSVCSEFPS